MKKIVGLVLVVAVMLTVITGCGERNENSNYLRVHIKADNNGEEHQNVKYKVKQELVDYITPFLAECNTKKEAYNTVKAQLKNIIKLCNEVLEQNGFDYNSKAYMANQYFPLRSYDGFTFNSGWYDSLIIELGSGDGDNWWCMVYPPLCFTGGENDGSGKITYKSKILEIIENFKKQYLS